MEQKAKAELIRILDIIGISIEWPDTIYGKRRQERFTTSLSKLMHLLGVEPFEAENKEREQEDTDAPPA